MNGKLADRELLEELKNLFEYLKSERTKQESDWKEVQMRKQNGQWNIKHKGASWDPLARAG